MTPLSAMEVIRREDPGARVSLQDFQAFYAQDIPRLRALVARQLEIPASAVNARLHVGDVSYGDLQAALAHKQLTLAERPN